MFVLGEGTDFAIDEIVEEKNYGIKRKVLVQKHIPVNKIVGVVEFREESRGFGFLYHHRGHLITSRFPDGENDFSGWVNVISEIFKVPLEILDVQNHTGSAASKAAINLNFVASVMGGGECQIITLAGEHSSREERLDLRHSGKNLKIPNRIKVKANNITGFVYVNPNFIESLEIGNECYLNMDGEVNFLLDEYEAEKIIYGEDEVKKRLFGNNGF